MVQKGKVPRWVSDFRIELYALKEYRGWTDEELGLRLGVSARTIANAKRDPCSVNGGIILRIQEMKREAETEGRK